MLCKVIQFCKSHTASDQKLKLGKAWEQVEVLVDVVTVQS